MKGTIDTYYVSSSIQFGGNETFCRLGYIFNLGVLKDFELKSQTNNIVKIHKDFEL